MKVNLGSGMLTFMTVIADEGRRVLLPAVRPGDHFDVQPAGEGKFLLTLMGSTPLETGKVTIEQRGGFSVGVLEHPINEQALAEALNDFP